MKTRDKISIAGFVLILLITGVIYLADLSRADSPFIQAVREGNILIVQECVEADPNIVNLPSPLARSTPLHEAAAFGQTEVVEWLLANGAAIDAERDARRTPLHMAVFHGHVETVKLLASRGANIKDMNGDTALDDAQNMGLTNIENLLTGRKEQAPNNEMQVTK